MRKFSAKETEWLLELDGIELANFWPRAFAFVIDWTLVGILLTVMTSLVAGGWLGVRYLQGKPLPDFQHMITEAGKNKEEVHVNLGPGKSINATDEHGALAHTMDFINDVLVPILYFGILTWKWHGQTVGKRLMKIRVMSIAHRHFTFWHSVERALGYGAAALEGGFGFVQFFIHPYRRCAQDRLAETIVVTEQSYQALQHRLSHPLVPDTE
jgi:hypothetical protein